MPWVRVLGAVVVAFMRSRVCAKNARFREILSPDLVTLMSPAHGSLLVGASGLYGVRRSAIRATYGHPPCGLQASTVEAAHLENSIPLGPTGGRLGPSVESISGKM